MSPAGFVIFVYCGLFYFIPIVGLHLRGQPDFSSYHYGGEFLSLIAVIFVFMLLCFTRVFEIIFSTDLLLNFRRICSLFLDKLILLISITLCILVIILFDSDAIDYRYKHYGISEHGSAMIFVIALKSFNTALCLWIIATFFIDKKKINLKYRLSLMFLAMSLFYACSGTGEFLRVALISSFFLFPLIAISFCTTAKHDWIFGLSHFLKSTAIIYIFLLAVISIHFGDKVKAGGHTATSAIVELAGDYLGDFKLAGGQTEADTASEDTASEDTLVLDKPMEVGRGRLQEGLSTHYYSIVQFFDGHADEQLKDHSFPLYYVTKSIIYRAKLLLGMKENNEKPDIQSISRLNFVVMSSRENKNEGTSAGVFGSFAYIAPLLASFLISFLYFVLIGNVINTLFNSQQYNLSVVGAIFAFFQLEIFFQSPLDLLLIFDNAFVFCATLLFLSTLLDRKITGFEEKSFLKC